MVKSSIKQFLPAQIALKLALVVSFTGLVLASGSSFFVYQDKLKQSIAQREALTFQIINQTALRISDRLEYVPVSKDFLAQQSFAKQSQSFIFDQSNKLAASSVDLSSNQTSYYPAIAAYLKLNKISTSSQIKLFIDQKSVLVQILPFSDRKGLDLLLVTALAEADLDNLGLGLINQSSYDWVFLIDIGLLLITVAIAITLIENDRQRVVDQFNTIVSASANGLIVVDHTNKILFANQLANQLLKLTAEVGTVQYFRVPSIEEDVPTEVELWQDQSSLIYLQVRAKTITWQDQAASFITLKDISDRKLAQTAQAESESKLQLFLNNSPAIIFIKDLEGRYIWVNYQFEQTFETTLSEVKGKTDFDFLPTAIANKLTNNDQLAMISKSAIQIEELVPLADGIHTYFSTKFPLFDQHKRPYATGGIAIDISDRKQMEEQMRQNQAQLQEAYSEQNALFLAITDTVIVRDQNGTCIKIAPSNGSNLLGEPEVIINQSIFDELPNNAATIIYLTIQEVLATNKTISCDYSLEKNGKTIWFAANISPISPDRVIQVAREITDRKEAEIALEQALATAQAATELKSEFLANMSHEIRTPMNGVLGMAQLLQLSELNNEQKEFVQTILDSGDSLLRIINDILDFSKIESDNLKLELIPFALEDTLQSLLAILNPQAQKKGLNLTYAIAKQTPAILIGDSIRLRQILVNLVGNSIKFSQDSEIKIEVTSERLTETRHRLQFAIIDFGIGISSDRIQLLFQPFIQADASISRRYGGTGLGLAICKRLIEMMEGNIWVESGGQIGGQPPTDWQIGKHDQIGSVFYFNMVLTESLLDQVSFIPSDLINLNQPRKLRLLVAEDNVVNQKLILFMLKKLDYEADLVSDGIEVLERLKQQDYDLIFMDMQMPAMDGISATIAIRTQNQFQPWIVAVTANALECDRQRCLEAGMNDFITKPFKVKDLSLAIAACPIKFDPRSLAISNAVV